MEEFAKVEKLVEITGATYEDARNALRACDGEMVDSMVYLEKLGKVTKYNNNSNQDPRFAPISAEEIAAAEYKKAMESLSRAQRKAQAKADKRAAERARRAAKRAESRSAFGELVRKIVRFLTHNNIVISKEGEEFASIPLLAVLIICSISVGLAVVAVFVSMMFGYEYSFRGESEMNEADRL